VVLLVKYSSNAPPANSATPSNTAPVHAAKTGILTRVLNIVLKVLMQEYETKKTKFNQRPYFRLFDNWLIEFNTIDVDVNANAHVTEADTADNTTDGSTTVDGSDTSAADNVNLSDSVDRSENNSLPANDGSSGTHGASGNSSLHLQILFIFGGAFSALQPARLPGFAFAWLELISHRNFMAKLLLAKSQKGWHLFQRLLGELFHFLEPYLRSAELIDPIRLLYKGTLRVLLVLLHDFPEFLCDYHFSFCDVIPPSCIQMRNLILSAFPRAMKLPDPFTPNLKVDLLPEINQPPRIRSDYLAAISSGSPISFMNEVDTYLKTRTPISFLIDMRSRFLLLSNQEALMYGTKYNVPVINSLVLYVGTQAIAQLQNKSSQVIPFSLFTSF
jgi:CCR4-Not complex component, Not1